MKTLLHLWRLLVEPRHDGTLARQPRRWQAVYPDGARSVPLSYATACDYAMIFGGDVVRWRE